MSRLASAGCLAALLLAGCGRTPEPQFKPAAATLKLMPAVREGMTATNDEGKDVRLEGVTDILAERFGTLAEPAVWPLLPIDFGGEPVTVAQVVAPSAEAAEKAEGEEEPLKEVTVTLAPAGGQSLGPLPVGSQVGWTGGTYEGKSHRVTSFDAKTGQVTLAGEFGDGLPEPGDELLVNMGGVLAEGQALYERHCLHCHGAGGAGDGPTAKYLDPKPRDYRLGTFKFTSTAGTDKASREDLIEIMRQGIPGTSMPAFRLLSDEDLHALAEYVRWLSMRGEYENELATVAAGYGYTQEAYEERIAGGETAEDVREEVKAFVESDLPEEAEATGENVASKWADALDESAVVTPTTPRVPDTPESRAKGRELFLSDKTKCATCHGVYGKGDGPQTESFQINPRTNEPYPHPGLYDTWDNPIRPRDLTQGVFRGGRRPIDVYRRLHAGIKGTPMAGFGGSLTEEEIWHLVNYVLNAPYESLPEPGRGKALVSTGH
ncbi:MAG TPA: cytochrome c [Planctomycetaceae bacterium]